MPNSREEFDGFFRGGLLSVYSYIIGAPCLERCTLDYE